MDDLIEAHRHRRFLFSSHAAAYEVGRPGYPERVYELLREICGLGPGSRVLEIGPGTGQATGRLLDHGASVRAVELGADLASRLRRAQAGRDLEVEVGAFEDVQLAAASVDLVAAATSFHWLPTGPGLRRCAEVLRPGGWLALWWAVFGDPDRPDPFGKALLPIFERLAPSLLDMPNAGARCVGSHLYALDVAARIAEIDATGCFGPVHHEMVAWSGRHSPAETRAPFASFSPWLALEPGLRSEVLDAIEHLAAEQFGGLVERPYLIPVYLAQRVG